MPCKPRACKSERASVYGGGGPTVLIQIVPDHGDATGRSRRTGHERSLSDRLPGHERSLSDRLPGTGTQAVLPSPRHPPGRNPTKVHSHDAQHAKTAADTRRRHPPTAG